MNLRELAELFAPFGYSFNDVKDRLSLGNSTFNAYEGLKLELELRWDDIENKTAEMEENFMRIKNIHLKSAIRFSDVQKVKAIKRSKMLAKLREKMISDTNNQLNKYLDKLEEQRSSNPSADEFLKELE